MTDTLIRASTALAVLAVAAIAAIISYQDAWEMVLAHGESGFTDRLLPCPVDGLILAASMVILDASRRDQHVPPLAAWSLGFGMAATVGANVAHGLGHGPIGTLVSACRRWPWLALVRVADAAHQAQPTRRRTRAIHGHSASACAGIGPLRTSRANPGADGPGLARAGAVSAPSHVNSASIVAK
jgi:Protein of unknown function (DUF2637)